MAKRAMPRKVSSETMTRLIAEKKVPHGLWYGVPGKRWYLAISSFKAHLKLVFFDGAHLRPLPPVAMKQAPARALDLREADALDEKAIAGWVKQARQWPGWGKA